MSLKNLWAKAELRKLQFVPGPWERCRKNTWALRMKRRLLQESERRRLSRKRKYNQIEEEKGHEKIKMGLKLKVKQEVNKNGKHGKKKPFTLDQSNMEQKDQESPISRKDKSLKSIGCAPSRMSGKSSTNQNTIQSSVSLKNRNKNHSNHVKLSNYHVKWWENSTSNNNKTDYHYGISLTSKENKQVCGEVTFNRNSNNVWELEMSSSTTALELTFSEDFLVLRIRVQSQQQCSFEIRFMHWSQMVRTMVMVGDKRQEDSFPVNFKTFRFVQKKELSSMELKKKLSTKFVKESLREILPIQTVVHQAVVRRYKSFSKALKSFVPDANVMRLI